MCNLDAQGDDAAAAAAAAGRPVFYDETVADVTSPVANWRPRPALPPNAVPSSVALMSIVAKLQSRQMAAIDWTRYSNGIDELEELALAFLTQAIAAVGSMRHVIDAQRQLIGRFVGILKKSGALTEDAHGEWTVDPEARIDPADFAARLHAEYPVCEVHILWLERASRCRAALLCCVARSADGGSSLLASCAHFL